MDNTAPIARSPTGSVICAHLNTRRFASVLAGITSIVFILSQDTSLVFVPLSCAVAAAIIRQKFLVLSAACSQHRFLLAFALSAAVLAVAIGLLAQVGQLLSPASALVIRSSGIATYFALHMWYTAIEAAILPDYIPRPLRNLYVATIIGRNIFGIVMCMLGLFGTDPNSPDNIITPALFQIFVVGFGTGISNIIRWRIEHMEDAKGLEADAFGRTLRECPTCKYLLFSDQYKCPECGKRRWQ